jgi:hydrogenase nickel incorporation protein HypA/HybF
MHELAIAEAVVTTVCESSDGARVARVVLQIGKLAAVLPDAVRFCFELASAGTDAEGAALEIVETPGLARCRACGAEFATDQPYGACACGSADLHWLAGDELTIREMEVVECA